MKKMVTTYLAIVLCGCGLATAGTMERVRRGFGAVLSATTSPQQLVIRQEANPDVVSNGTFAAVNSWVTNTGWSIHDGAMYWSVDDPATNTAYQPCAALEDGEQYRVRFTVSGIDPTTNTVTAIIGATTGTVRVADGTYTEDLFMYGTSSNITFRATATNIGETATFSIDNVIVRKLADEAYANEMQIGVGPLDVPVYFIINGNAVDMTNCYAESQCMVVNSNGVVEIHDDGNRRIKEVWYRTASGTATATLNAN